MGDRSHGGDGREVHTDGVHLYVYAIVASSTETVVTGMTGLDGSELELVGTGRSAAVVGPVAQGRIRPTRANLVAHQRVVAELHDRGPVLPVRFGTVMPGAEAVVDQLLGPGEADHLQRLQALEGHDEFRLKVSYLPGVALREAVDASPAIRRLRSRVRAARGRGGQGEQIRLGEMVFAELTRLRESDAADLVDRLAPCLTAIEVMEDDSDDVALRAALLVDRNRATRFEELLEQVARKEEHRLQVELVGPLPAWDFTEGDPGAG